jgi:hypothetical protein
MKKIILPILLLANSSYAFANWSSTVTINPLTDKKEGIASIRPTDTTKISIICKEGETPGFAVTWKEPNSAKNITHYQYRVDKDEIIIINVNSVIGDRTTVSIGSIKSIFKDLFFKKRVIVKGIGPKYETSLIEISLDKSAIALKKACSWHPFYNDLFSSEEDS